MHSFPSSICFGGFEKNWKLEALEKKEPLQTQPTRHCGSNQAPDAAAAVPARLKNPFDTHYNHNFNTKIIRASS
jgi:hypothetical protein